VDCVALHIIAGNFDNAAFRHVLANYALCVGCFFGLRKSDGCPPLGDWGFEKERE
jgi:hypothetical protein